MVKTSTAIIYGAIALGFLAFGGIGLTRRAVNQTQDAVNDFKGALETLGERVNKNG